MALAYFFSTMGLTLVNLGSRPQERLPRVASLESPDGSHLVLLSLHFRHFSLP